MNKTLSLVVSSVALMGCTHAPSQPAAPLTTLSALSVDVQSPALRKVAPSAPAWSPLDVLADAPREALAVAHEAARQRPALDGFVAATHFYDYAPGAIYDLYAVPGYVSTILLEPGEQVADIAAGDTARWMVSKAVSSEGGASRALVLVKPKVEDLRTNIVLVTDRRVYMIEAISTVGEAYSAQIAWRYPAAEAPIKPMPKESVDPLINLDRLNFAYRIRTVKGSAPHWAPERVFDDGRKTWVEFPTDIASSDMPPLFVISGEGAELVNYRVQGRRYMVDRIFDVAELRLGRGAPVVVRIEREARGKNAPAEMAP